MSQKTNLQCKKIIESLVISLLKFLDFKDLNFLMLFAVN